MNMLLSITAVKFLKTAEILKTVAGSLGRPLFLILILLLSSIFMFTGCGSKSGDVKSRADAAELHFPGSPYVSGYTRGLIRADGSVSISLQKAVSESVQQRSGNLFSVKPSVRGEMVWTDAFTARFHPAEKLQNGKVYTFSFDLPAVVDEPDADVFRFPVQVLPQDFELTADPPQITENDRVRISGSIRSADIVELSRLERSVLLRLDGRNVPLEWKSVSPTDFEFVSAAITKTAQKRSATLSWDWREAGGETRGRETIDIPAESDFYVTGYRVERSGSPFIRISFSKFLEETQQLRGMVLVNNSEALTTILHRNELRVYPTTERRGDHVIQLFPGITAKGRSRLDETVELNVDFGDVPPELRLIGSGVILPDSKDLLLPFESVNLGAVDVQITRIFEENIPQFLQQGDMDRSWGIREVGKPVVQKVIPLQTLGDVNPGQWNTYALDLSELIEPEQGALYAVTLGFRRHQSLYPCEQELTMETADSENRWVLSPRDEQNYWSEFDSWWMSGNYRWNERDNPCSDSYYTSNVRVYRNVLASNIGLLAKAGPDGSMLVFATNLKTAAPMPGVSVTALDYQYQRVGQGHTGSDGSLKLNAGDEIYLLKAALGKQRGFLRTPRNAALSISEFDVTGVSPSEGLQGFMFAERDVHRPGDSLYVHLIVEPHTGERFPDVPARFELRDPGGRLSEVQTVRPVGGMYAFRSATPRDAQTGRWMVQAQIGGSDFFHRLNIENILPNRLAIEVNFDDERLIWPRQLMDAQIRAEWLHGAIAQNLNFEIEAGLREVPFGFSDYAEFRFTDPGRTAELAPALVADGALDSDGAANVAIRLDRLADSPPALSANVVTRVFEPSGSINTHRSQFTVLAYNRFAGIRLPDLDSEFASVEYETQTTAQLVLLDADGKPQRDAELMVEVYELEWRWWWQRSREQLSQYFQQSASRPVFRVLARTQSDGKATVTLPTHRLDYGRYFVRVMDEGGGHAAGMEFYVGYGSSRISGAPAMLVLETDQETYRPGDNLNLSFNGVEGGKALITTETAGRVIDWKWVDTQAGENKAAIRITEEMRPNVYVSVHLLQPHGQSSNDLPVRMFGIVPVTVQADDAMLKPVARVPEQVRPGDEMTIQISEDSGRAMTYTIMVVDEGLLNLTNFRTPDPFSAFNRRRALGIRTWDLFDMVAGVYAGSMRRILSVGGDMEIDPDADADGPGRFRPVVRVMGPFLLDAGASRTHAFTMPAYTGRVRTMVVATNPEHRRHGSTTANTLVKQPLMLLGSAPSHLNYGDSLVVSATVFADAGISGNVQLELRSEGAVKNAGGESGRRMVSFSEAGTQTARFSITGTDEGEGQLFWTATSGREQASYAANLQLSRYGDPITEIIRKQAEPGDTTRIPFTATGIDGTQMAVAEVSTIPAVDFESWLQRINRYPFGSIERQISAVFPLLWLKNAEIQLSDDFSRNADRDIERLIQEIPRFMHASGAVSMWPGSPLSDDWMSSYALHFLHEASRSGYYVSSQQMDPLLKYVRRAASGWRAADSGAMHHDLVQAYRLYVLAKIGQPDMGAMNRFREMPGLSVQARWRLAAAYAATGQDRAAVSLISSIPADANAGSGRWMYGSAVRDQAFLLQTLVYLDMEPEAADALRDLVRIRENAGWVSPQAIAFSIGAMTDFIKKYGAGDQLELKMSGSGLDATAVASQSASYSVRFRPDLRSGELVIENKGNARVYITLSVESVPDLAARRISEDSNGLVQQLRYLTADGSVADLSRLYPGMEITAEVRITNPGTRGDMEQLALVQPVPAGWQPLPGQIDAIVFGETQQETSAFFARDRRDSEIITYFRLSAGETKTFAQRFTVVYEGEFLLAPVRSVSVSDARIFARSASDRIRISRSAVPVP
ncbi:MAG: hypothetical protein LAT67_00745 [Balneolales bacterium]|nr:hypothetical protein [Balneolales bacterium]